MLNWILGGIFFIAMLFIGFLLFRNYLMKGGNVFLKDFKNTRVFEYEFKGFKGKKKSLFNRQGLDLVFNDSSKVHIFGGIEDRSIIPLMGTVLNVDDDDIRAGSMHKSIQINEFVKNFEVQAIQNIKIIDKHNNPVGFYVSKGIKFEDNKQYISISLDGEHWSNIKSIHFESTVEIDISLIYYYFNG